MVEHWSSEPKVVGSSPILVDCFLVAVSIHLHQELHNTTILTQRKTPIITFQLCNCNIITCTESGFWSSSLGCNDLAGNAHASNSGLLQ